MFTRSFLFRCYKNSRLLTRRRGRASTYSGLGSVRFNPTRGQVATSGGLDPRLSMPLCNRTPEQRESMSRKTWLVNCRPANRPKALTTFLSGTRLTPGYHGRPSPAVADRALGATPTARTVVNSTVKEWDGGDDVPTSTPRINNAGRTIKHAPTPTVSCDSADSSTA
jgi:hypothetical protein